MIFKLDFNSLFGKTNICKPDATIFSMVYRKAFFKKEWFFYHEERLIARCKLYSKFFSRKAVMKTKVVFKENTIEMEFLSERCLSGYLISSLFDDDIYIIYPHNNDKFSFFMNSIQIGSLVRIQNGENFVNTWILMKNDNISNTTVIIIAYVALILGEKGFDRWGDSPTGGYWLKEVKSFDPLWMP